MKLLAKVKAITALMAFCGNKIVLKTFLCLVLSVLTFTQAYAGRILISGSDWDTVHNGDNLGDDIITYLDQSATKDVLVLGNSTAVASFDSNLSFATATSLAGVNLNDYSGLYVLARNGCCNTDTSVVSGHQAAINAFIASGGNLGLQNYIGSAVFDSILGTTGGANQFVGGWMGGTNAVNNCYYNGGGLTAAGATAGFQNGYTNQSCWGHQGYNMSYFSGLGFTSLIDTPVAGFSAIMAKDTGSVAVPEPGSIALFGLGLLCLGVSRRRLSS